MIWHRLEDGILTQYKGLPLQKLFQYQNTSVLQAELKA
jgi:hypothetical protein